MLSSVSRFPFTAGAFFVADLVTSIFDLFFFVLCNFFGLSSPSLLPSSAVLFKLLISLLVLESSGDHTSVSASVR